LENIRDFAAQLPSKLRFENIRDFAAQLPSKLRFENIEAEIMLE